MSTPEQRRARAERLHAQAVAGGRRGRRRLRREIDAALDELREEGYVELPDGRWLNPQGEVVKGP